jgi:hypothetical protein
VRCLYLNLYCPGIRDLYVLLDSSVGIATRLWAGQLRNQDLIPGKGRSFSVLHRLALRPTQPTVQLIPGALSLGVKQVGHEADCSLLSSAEVKNKHCYMSIPHMSSWHGI